MKLTLETINFTAPVVPRLGFKVSCLLSFIPWTCTQVTGQHGLFSWLAAGNYLCILYIPFPHRRRCVNPHKACSLPNHHSLIQYRHLDSGGTSAHNHMHPKLLSLVLLTHKKNPAKPDIGRLRMVADARMTNGWQGTVIVSRLKSSSSPP